MPHPSIINHFCRETASRVTRSAELSPFGQFLLWAIVKEKCPNIWAALYTKSNVSSFTRHGSCQMGWATLWAILGVYWAILVVYWAIFHKKHPITLAVIETLHGNTNRKISTWRKLGAKLFLFNKLQLPPTVLREMADFLLLVKLFPGNGNTHTHTGFVSFRCV
jgi:hypothetical protein